jgi:protocatechuate 3,4-dioxygenase beta subunit
MRPIHALILVLLLAGVLAGAFFLIRSDGDAGQGGSAIVGPGSTGGTETVEPSKTALDAAPGDPNSADRTKVVPVASTSTTPASASGGVRGRVVDPESKPVAGATVYAGTSGGIADLPLDEISPGMFGPKPVSAVTDADGRFLIQPDVKGSMRVAVRAGGFAPFDAEKPLAGASTDLGDLRLERGVVLHGRVIDPAGRGVAGAEIHRSRTPTGGMVVSLGGGFGGPVVATTDASGAFKVDQLAVGPWTLSVTHERFPDKTQRGETESPGQVVSNVVIQLEQGFEIAGRISGAPAEALQSLSVRAQPSSGGDIGTFGVGGVRRGKVLADGSFTIGGCRENQAYKVSARPKEREIFMSGARSDAVDAKAGDRDVLLKYKSETALVFQVVDSQTGAPVEKMSVSAGYRFPLPLFDETTKKEQRHFPEGRVRFPSVGGQAGEGNNGQLVIEASGYETWERKDMRFVQGVDNDLGVIRLTRAPSVRVTVLDDATGAPVAGARVWLNEVTAGGSTRGMRFSMTVGAGDEDGDMMFGGGSKRETTNAEGVAVLTSMPGKSATISVQHKEHARFTSAPIELPSAGDHAETVRIQRGGTVVVTVQDGAGQPVAGMAVDMKQAEGAPATIMPGMGDDKLSDANGQVTFAHVPAGTHAFRVRTPGGNGALAIGGGGMFRAARFDSGLEPSEGQKGWTDVVVAEGQTANVNLLAPARGALSGKVRERGKTLAGATVRLKKKGDDGPDFGFLDGGTSATTNSSGEYSFEGLEVAEYKATITHPSRVMSFTGETDVREGANRFDVDLPLAIVEGRVLGEDQKPLAGVKVRAERARSEEAEEVHAYSVVMMNGDADGEAFSFGDGVGAPPVTTDGEGRYKLRGVTPGVGLNIVASSPGVQTARSDRIEVAPDQTLGNIDLVLKLGATVEVVTKRLDGKPASGCIVHAVRADDEDAEPKTQFVGSTGRVTFSGLQPGRWRFTCNKAGFDPGEGDAQKIPDQELEAKVGAPGTVTFQVP